MSIMGIVRTQFPACSMTWNDARLWIYKFAGLGEYFTKPESDDGGREAPTRGLLSGQATCFFHLFLLLVISIFTVLGMKFVALVLKMPRELELTFAISRNLSK